MNRYTRQTGLPEIGEAGQEKLRRARVLLVGVGGLGAPISLYLTGAGIGHLGIIDDDVVSVSNLHRQVLYTEEEVGQPKAECAARRLRALNSDVEVTPYACRLTEANAEEIIRQYDLVVDGCDNYATRYLIDDVTARLGIPYIYGAVRGYEGQASVFNLRGGGSLRGGGLHAAEFQRASSKQCAASQSCETANKQCPPRYRDLYPTPPPAPTDKSLVGMTPALVGSVLAHEVLKLVCGYGDTLAGRLWTIDLRTLQSFTLDL